MGANQGGTEDLKVEGVCSHYPQTATTERPLLTGGASANDTSASTRTNCRGSELSARRRLGYDMLICTDAAASMNATPSCPLRLSSAD